MAGTGDHVVLSGAGYRVHEEILEGHLARVCLDKSTRLLKITFMPPLPRTYVLVYFLIKISFSDSASVSVQTCVESCHSLFSPGDAVGP